MKIFINTRGYDYNTDYSWFDSELVRSYKDYWAYIEDFDSIDIEEFNIILIKREDGVFCALITSIDTNRVDVRGRNIKNNLFIVDTTQSSLINMTMNLIQNPKLLQSNLDQSISQNDNNKEFGVFIKASKLNSTIIDSFAKPESLNKDLEHQLKSFFKDDKRRVLPIGVDGHITSNDKNYSLIALVSVVVVVIVVVASIFFIL